MRQTINLHEHFNFSYRADCTTCTKYVGPKRKTKQEADKDAQVHKSNPANTDHDVKIEVTQSFHIL